MKPPAADGDLLGPGFECIGEQYSAANAGRAAAKLPARQSAAHMMCDAARAMSDHMQISAKDYPTRNTFAANGKMHTIRKSS